MTDGEGKADPLIHVDTRKISVNTWVARYQQMATSRQEATDGYVTAGSNGWLCHGREQRMATSRQ